MEILLGLLVLGFGFWLWSRRGDGAHQKYREDMGYGEPVSELEPIFPEKKRKVLSNVEKKAAALEVLEDNDVERSLFEIVNTGWHVSRAAAFNEIEPDEFPSDRIVALGYVECHERAADYVASLQGFDWTEPNCFVLDGDHYDFFCIEEKNEGAEKTKYRLHVLVNEKLVADFGLGRDYDQALILTWYPHTSDIGKLILDQWVEKLADLLELLQERRRWREDNVRIKKDALNEQSLQGKIDLGDYEP